MITIGIIPARYDSSRFPGKPLADILGKSMIQRVYEQCKKASKLNDVIIATDDHRILSHVKEFGGKAILTSKLHKTGTERCNEVAKNITEKFDLIVNIQGDEPLINPMQIDEVIELFNDPRTQIGTLAKQIDDITILKKINSPKAIFDSSGFALNFCRKIPNIIPRKTYYKHVGIYAYKKEILEEICNLPQSKNEIKESLEQLRWLDNKYKIKVGKTFFQTSSVDVPNDIEEIKQQMI